MNRLSVLKEMVCANFILAKFLLAICILTLTGIFSHLAVRETIVANDRVTHTFKVIVSLSDFERHFRSAELMRGLVAAGRDNATMRSALDLIVRSMEAEYQKLLSLTADNQKQQERLERLNELLPEDKTPGHYQARVGVMRVLVQEMNDEEQALLKARTDHLASRYSMTRWFMLFGKLSSFALLGWSFWQQAMEIRRRRVAEGALIQANELLVERLKGLTGNG